VFSIRLECIIKKRFIKRKKSCFTQFAEKRIPIQRLQQFISVVFTVDFCRDSPVEQDGNCFDELPFALSILQNFNVIIKAGCHCPEVCLTGHPCRYTNFMFKMVFTTFCEEHGNGRYA